MNANLLAVTTVWERCIAEASSPAAERSDDKILDDLGLSFAGFWLDMQTRMPGIVLPCPPGSIGDLVIAPDMEFSSFNVVRTYNDSGALELGLKVLAKAQQILTAGAKSVAMSSCASFALDIFGMAMYAGHLLQSSIFQREALFATWPRGLVPPTALGESRSLARAELDTLLDRVSKPEVFAAAAALIAATTPSDPPPLPTDSCPGPSTPSSTSRRGGGKAGGSGTGVSEAEQRAQNNIRYAPGMLEKVGQILYFLAVCARDEVQKRKDTRAATALVRSLVDNLERSQVLEAACGALMDLATTTPPQAGGVGSGGGGGGGDGLDGARKKSKKQQQQQRQRDRADGGGGGGGGGGNGGFVVPEEEEQRLKDMTFALAYLANGMSVLAATAREMSAASGPLFAPAGTGSGAAGRGGGDGLAADQMARKEVKERDTLSRRLAALLLRPQTQRLQRVLLERFCLDGGLPPLSAAAATAAAATTSTPTTSASSPPAGSLPSSSSSSSSGWPLDDQLRMDHQLVKLYDGYFGSPMGSAGPDSPQQAALLALSSPALLTWSAATAHPAALHGELPAEVDALVARTARALVGIVSGRGDSTGGCGFDRIRDVSVLDGVLAAMLPCSPEIRLFNKLDADSGAAAGGTSIRDRCVSAPAEPVRCTPPYSPDSLEVAGWQVAAHVAITEVLTTGWACLDRAAQLEAGRRLVAAGLLPSLDHALRLLIAHTCSTLVADHGLSKIYQTMGHLIVPLLKAALTPGQPAASTAASGSSSPAPDLGLFVTIAKLSRRLSGELQAATDAALAPGGTRPPTRERLATLRGAVCDCFDVLVALCATVGPVGVPAELRDVPIPPEARAVSLVCLRAALAAGLALLRSLDAQARAEGRTPQQLRELCRREDDVTGGFSGILHRAFSVIRGAPACITAAAGGGPHELPPPALLATCPGELLALCLEVAGLVLRSGEAGARGRSREQLVAERADTVILTHGVRHTVIAVTGLAARREYAPHVHAWLTGDAAAAAATGGGGQAGGGSQAGAGAGAGAAGRLMRALDELAGLVERERGFWPHGSAQTANQIRGLMALATAPRAPVPPEGRRQQAAEAAAEEEGWRGLWRGGRRLLRDISATSRQEVVDDPQLGAALGGFLADTSCVQAVRGARMRSDSQGFAVRADGAAADEGEEEVEEGEEGSAGSGPLPEVRMCGYPGCSNFAEAREGLLKLKQCGGCQAVRYCGPDCQRRDWPQHKPVCRKK